MRNLAAGCLTVGAKMMFKLAGVLHQEDEPEAEESYLPEDREYLGEAIGVTMTPEARSMIDRPERRHDHLQPDTPLAGSIQDRVRRARGD